MIGLSDEHIHIMGHISLETTCGKGIDVREINANYLIMDVVTPYNIILGRMANNALVAIVSTFYLTLKYLLPDRRAGTIYGN